MITSRRPVSRYGFGSGGVSGVRPLPKSIPRPAPVSVLLPLLAGCRSEPLSLTRSFCLSTPFAACAKAGREQAINISRPIVKRNITTPFLFTTMNFKGDSQLENRLTNQQLQACIYDESLAADFADERESDPRSSAKSAANITALDSRFRASFALLRRLVHVPTCGVPRRLSQTQRRCCRS